jgi:hypothetical protein
MCLRCSHNNFWAAPFVGAYSCFIILLSSFQIDARAQAQAAKAQPDDHTVGRLGMHQNTLAHSDYDSYTMPDAFGRFLRKVRSLLPGAMFYYVVSKSCSRSPHIDYFTMFFLVLLSHHTIKPQLAVMYNYYMSHAMLSQPLILIRVPSLSVILTLCAQPLFLLN